MYSQETVNELSHVTYGKIKTVALLEMNHCLQYLDEFKGV